MNRFLLKPSSIIAADVGTHLSPSLPLGRFCVPKRQGHIITHLLFCMLFSPMLYAATFNNVSANEELIGSVQTINAGSDDTFETIARRYNMGYFELVEANRNISDPDNLSSGTKVIVPTQFLIPDAKREGIVINLAELRLYYFDSITGQLITQPIGIGRQGWQTPVSVSRITSKQAKPTWTVPETIRSYSAEQGVYLPKQVPPGPDNPLGDYAMRLTLSGYLIHGTNQPPGVGRRSSAGCIRMYPEGIEQLFKRVAVGTKVNIINEPIKLGFHGGDLFMEVHQPLQEDGYRFSTDDSPAVEKIKGLAKIRPLLIDWAKVQQVMKDQSGIPTRIGRDAS
jgi:L,D-transpeptidase ErfK/SrfK